MAEKDYFYENYRMADFYDDQYGVVNHDIPFWLNITSNQSEVLEIASGTGRITLPLLKTGKKIYAIDYSDEMLTILNDKIDANFMDLKKNITIKNADMRYLNLDKKFDMIIITSNSLNHIETNEDIEKTFKSISNHLNDNGILVFDVLNPKFEFLLRDPKGIYFEEVLKHTKSNRYFKTWENNEYSYGEQINYVTYYYQFSDENGNPTTDEIVKMRLKVRLFYPQEMDYLIQKSDFEIIHKYDWYDNRSWNGKTGEQIYVLKKK